MSIWFLLATSQACNSSSLVPHREATEPFWSNSPRSHWTERIKYRSRWNTYNVMYQVICIIALSMWFCSFVWRWNPYLSKPLGRKVRNFRFQVRPPAHFTIVAVPRKKLNLLEHFSLLDISLLAEQPTINGFAVFPSGPSRMSDSAAGFRPIRSKSQALGSNILERRNLVVIKGDTMAVRWLFEPTRFLRHDLARALIP